MILLVSGIAALAFWVLGILGGFGPGVHMFLVIGTICVTIGLTQAAHRHS
ncbi:hypothetical protein [Sinomonas mesophila]|nr:hypothetical protein [Sinomonas mesophila]